MGKLAQAKRALPSGAPREAVCACMRARLLAGGCALTALPLQPWALDVPDELFKSRSPPRLSASPGSRPQGLLLLQFRGHRGQAPAAEAEREQDAHRGLGEWAQGEAHFCCPRRSRVGTSALQKLPQRRRKRSRACYESVSRLRSGDRPIPGSRNAQRVPAGVGDPWPSPAGRRVRDRARPRPPHLSGRPLPGRTRGCARPSLPVAAPSPSLRGCPACAGLACFPMSRRCHLTPSQPRKAGWLKLSPDSTKRCRALRPGGGRSRCRICRGPRAGWGERPLGRRRPPARPSVATPASCSSTWALWSEVLWLGTWGHSAVCAPVTQPHGPMGWSPAYLDGTSHALRNERPGAWRRRPTPHRPRGR